MKKAVYLGKETRHQPVPCLDCGKVLDAAMGVGHKSKPRAGSITVCIACGHLQAYAWDMQLRELTDEEMRDVAGDERIIAIQKARQGVQKAWLRFQIAPT